MVWTGLPCDKNAGAIFGHPQDGPAGIAHRDVGYKVGRSHQKPFKKCSIPNIKNPDFL